MIQETALSWVICNLKPIHPKLGHFLVVPKDHKTKLSDLSNQERLDIFSLLDEFIREVEEKINPEGINILFNQGEVAGQTCEHFHVHIICRQDGDEIINYHRNGDRPEIKNEAIERLKQLLA
jgi:diadenosine tetraphosphate (Ap4A) HIT family hydrolase